ncbi:hypothetical protein C2845_PM14G01520 [Panicum miliaceum]|uniref:Pectinesterase inhibitor domain-containing protein n=1 Tax=Panicum miliaceum TaxID=4540 RepID=A0A3L6PTY7_PANMI|nr:hypothetical protein C2845_PM14G01520 [Panicum miliaceum]
MTSMSLLVAIVVAFSLGFTVVAGGCPGARRNMTMEAACCEACGAAPAPATARAMYQLCMDTLSDDDLSVDEAGEYAYRASWRALWAYLDTMGRAWHLLGNAALAAGEEKAVLRRRQYKRAMRDVEACRDRVAKLPSSPLLVMVEADYNRTILAYLLGKLIGVK